VRSGASRTAGLRTRSAAPYSGGAAAPGLPPSGLGEIPRTLTSRSPRTERAETRRRPGTADGTTGNRPSAAEGWRLLFAFILGSSGFRRHRGLGFLRLRLLAPAVSGFSGTSGSPGSGFPGSPGLRFLRFPVSPAPIPSVLRLLRHLWFPVPSGSRFPRPRFFGSPAASARTLRLAPAARTSGSFGARECFAGISGTAADRNHGDPWHAYDGGSQWPCQRSVRTRSAFPPPAPSTPATPRPRPRRGDRSRRRDRNLPPTQVACRRAGLSRGPQGIPFLPAPRRAGGRGLRRLRPDER
jgi:hypothetical protein